jgi:hypothetical protein
MPLCDLWLMLFDRDSPADAYCLYLHPFTPMTQRFNSDSLTWFLRVIPYAVISIVPHLPHQRCKLPRYISILITTNIHNNVFYRTKLLTRDVTTLSIPAVCVASKLSLVITVNQKVPVVLIIMLTNRTYQRASNTPFLQANSS